jgi:DNA-binding NarL/FixJ family response regulator
VKPLRILLVDDHRMFRQGLRSLLADLPDMEVVGEADRAADALEAVERDPPDVVLLDISLPDSDGLAIAEAMRKRWPGVKLVLLSIHGVEAYVRRAEQIGAGAYLVKDCTPEALVAAIRNVAGDGPFQAVVGAGEGRPGRRRLTGRQTEVLRRIALGRKLHEIAEELGISVRTAERHRANIKDVLGIHSAAGLIRYAIRNGLVEESAVDFSRIETEG